MKAPWVRLRVPTELSDLPIVEDPSTFMAVLCADGSVFTVGEVNTLGGESDEFSAFYGEGRKVVAVCRVPVPEHS